MTAESRRSVVHLIEPQQLFTEILVDVFMEAGLNVDYVGISVDVRLTIDSQPDILFLDADYLPEPIDAIKLARVLAPKAAIVAYSSGSPQVGSDMTRAGADVVLEKSTERRAIVQRLRDIERSRKRRSST